MTRLWLGGLAALAVACGSSGGLTGTAVALRYPPTLAADVAAAQPAIAARYPSCSLAGWSLETRPLPFLPPTGALCGATPCTGLVRGHTSFDARRITVWEMDPHRVAVIAWEGCNACRWATAGQIVDAGCGG